VARVLLSALGAGYNGQAWSHAEKAVAQHSLFSQLRPRRPTKVLKEFLEPEPPTLTPNLT